jgi:hypothetical protein
MKSSVHHSFPPPKSLLALRALPVDGATPAAKDGLAEAQTVTAMTSSKYEDQTYPLHPLCVRFPVIFLFFTQLTPTPGTCLPPLLCARR